MYYVSLELIDPNPWQPRQVYTGIEELAESIKAHIGSRPNTRGLLQLPAGRVVKDGNRVANIWTPDTTNLDAWLMGSGYRVQLAFGHRRMEAFRSLDQPLLPLELGDYSDEEMATMAWSENSARKDLTAIEEARGIEKMIQDFGWTQRDAAEKLKLDRSTISNKLRLLKLPADVQAGIQEGKMSERQAQSIQGLYDLPEDIRTKAESSWEHSTKPSWIVKDAMTGASSDNIRERIQQILRRYGSDLSDKPWVDHEFEGNVQSPTCKPCEKRIKERNFCLDQDCAELKGRLFQDLSLVEASAASGIPVLEADKISAYVETLDSWRGQEYASTVKASGCENLRLAYTAYPDREPDIPDHPHAKIVCSKRSGFCSCLNGAKTLDQAPIAVEAGENGSGPTQEALQEAARAARLEKREAKKLANDYVEEAGKRIAEALRDRYPGAWRLLAGEIDYTLRRDGLQNAGYDKLIEAIGKYLAEKALPYEITTTKQLLASINAQLIKAHCEPIGILEGEVFGAEKGKGKSLIEVFGDEALPQECAEEPISHSRAPESGGVGG